MICEVIHRVEIQMSACKGASLSSPVRFPPPPPTPAPPLAPRGPGEAAAFPGCVSEQKRPWNPGAPRCPRQQSALRLPLIRGNILTRLCSDLNLEGQRSHVWCFKTQKGPKAGSVGPGEHRQRGHPGNEDPRTATSCACVEAFRDLSFVAWCPPSAGTLGLKRIRFRGGNEGSAFVLVREPACRAQASEGRLDVTSGTDFALARGGGLGLGGLFSAARNVERSIRGLRFTERTEFAAASARSRRRERRLSVGHIGARKDRCPGRPQCHCAGEGAGRAAGWDWPGAAAVAGPARSSARDMPHPRSYPLPGVGTGGGSRGGWGGVGWGARGGGDDQSQPRRALPAGMTGLGTCPGADSPTPSGKGRCRGRRRGAAGRRPGRRGPAKGESRIRRLLGVAETERLRLRPGRTPRAARTRGRGTQRGGEGEDNWEGLGRSGLLRGRRRENPASRVSGLTLENSLLKGFFLPPGNHGAAGAQLSWGREMKF
ncbi:collagen alpha-1(I) chain-like [Acinonyx jubatus]|uniref:Collagen alpha-1(I) chain-like n=1 Tax=Acinonyx jubatus TaxID=32536 RepID=A0ABM3NXP0_ACIJB|nr:collagen alpha-1(I) chain-like [Acinonyx jubatus]